VYYKGKLYIPNNKELRGDIVKSCHDSSAAGHPSKHSTLELVSRLYWWPQMASFVDKYVLGCEKCQRYKPAQHSKAVLQPQEVPAGPWQHVGIDLITQLPPSNHFNSIAVYVDHYSDQAHLVLCKSNLMAEGAADLHYRDVFRLHGIPKKVFSNCGPQFAARFMCALYKHLGIETGLTTAYHPKGNGKVERKNQEVEQYLRLFCDKRQEDWAEHLPAAEFALNSCIHSGTSKAPFELIYGYCPDFTVPIGKHSNIPGLDQRLDHLAKVRADAEAALRLSKEKMKEQYKRDKKTAHTFNVGDLVWLQAKDIKIHQKSPKLGPRQLGPFKVIKRIGDLDFKLDLPHYLKLHPVFHVNRLAPYRDNGLDKPPPPDPVTVEGEEEYEVDKITDSRIFRCQLQYRVKWKGYEEGSDSWEPAANLTHAKRKIADFHQKYSSAPKKLAATAFDGLLPLFRTLLTDTTADPALFPEVLDLDWENGKFFTLDTWPPALTAVWGHTGMGRG
jgi:hypothetical protein